MRKRPKPWKLASRLAWRIGRVQIHAVAVDLPDFDERVAERIAGRIEDAAGQVRDLADARRDAVVDDEQIVVGIERQLVGIERPFGLGRREGERLGERAAAWSRRWEGRGRRR